jgi:predicted alpha/beta superfamily hydrolase
MRRELNIDGHPIWLFEPDEAQMRPVIYMHAGSCDEAENIWRLAGEKGFALAFIGGIDWNRDMSPWPATKVFRDGEDFSGKADDYLAVLTGKILPEVEKKLISAPAGRGIAGYSLSGLFALYSLYRTGLFNMAGSMSGSMWFDGWIRFMERSVLLPVSPKIYLSLGDKEKRTGNTRMAAVESCTIKTAELLRLQGAEVLFELNPGNHFVNAAERIAKGLRWLTRLIATP